MGLPDQKWAKSLFDRSSQGLILLHMSMNIPIPGAMTPVVTGTSVSQTVLAGMKNFTI